MLALRHNPNSTCTLHTSYTTVAMPNHTHSSTTHRALQTLVYCLAYDQCSQPLRYYLRTVRSTSNSNMVYVLPWWVCSDKCHQLGRQNGSASGQAQSALSTPPAPFIPDQLAKDAAALSRPHGGGEPWPLEHWHSIHPDPAYRTRL